MSAVDAAAAPVKPAHGAYCPVCNVGILFKIAESDEGEYLACFNCDTRGTVHKTEDWSPVRGIDDAGSPTGFQLSPDQIAAKREAGIDPANLGSPASTSSAPAAAVPAVEPHEQHDVVPPSDQEPPPAEVQPHG